LSLSFWLTFIAMNMPSISLALWTSSLSNLTLPVPGIHWLCFNTKWIRKPIAFRGD
jgi:hypothetical protein